MKKKFNFNKKGILIIIIIIIISIYFISSTKSSKFQEDIIFFKIFKEEKQKKANQYIAKISKKVPNYVNVNLMQTVDYNTLVNEKIAPGSKGEFEILLTSNQDLNYKIELVSKNEKPKNLQFDIDKEKLKRGTIKQNEVIKIPVNWEWKYETSKTSNIEDTIDGQNIIKYNFEIHTIRRIKK